MSSTTISDANQQQQQQQQQPATLQPPNNNKRNHPTKNGTIVEFDTSEQSCKVFGFFAGSRVTTPKGNASVIGVRSNNLWFHIDGDKGASYWDNGKDYEALVFELGVRLIDDFVPEDFSNQYRVKRISYKGKEVSIILQNENGPCPLISIANVLLLQQKIALDPDTYYVSLKKMGDLIIKHAKLIYKDDQDVLPIIDDYDKNILPSLESGLIVNIHFNSIFGFEKTAPCQIFDYLHIKLVHGWIIDPEQQKDVNTLIGNLSYNELAPKLVSFDQSFPNSTLAVEQKIKDFYSSYQVTDYGLKLIQANLQEDELCVFFRNNHFATMTKHDGFLHILVSDVGYERERNIIWDRIITKDGESLFLSGEFRSRKQVAVDEAKSSLAVFGFKTSEVDEAIKYITDLDKTDDLLDEALKFLNSKGYTPS
eukprot:gene6652-8230_t